MDITNIPNISPFIPDNDPTSVSQRWKRWSDRFDNLMTAMNITALAKRRYCYIWPVKLSTTSSIGSSRR